METAQGRNRRCTRADMWDIRGKVYRVLRVQGEWNSFAAPDEVLPEVMEAMEPPYPVNYTYEREDWVSREEILGAILSVAKWLANPGRPRTEWSAYEDYSSADDMFADYPGLGDVAPQAISLVEGIWNDLREEWHDRYTSDVLFLREQWARRQTWGKLPASE